MEGNFGIYAGIVVQNNDPDQCGRIKVYVPGINGSVFDGWTGDATDKAFTHIDGDIISIIEQLRQDLPWADCASGMFSGNTDHLSVGDSPQDIIRPSDEHVKTPPVDAYDKTSFTPGDYQGTSSGTFTMPNIGAHVYVFFKSGNVMFPVYFASAHKKEVWEDIYKDGNYVTDHELAGVGPYKGKQVFNTNKHTLEFIDSDSSEEVRLSHFSGSNIRMLNSYNSRYAVHDDYTLTENNETETVGNDRFVDIGNDLMQNIGNDQMDTIGHDLTMFIGNDQKDTVTNDLTMNIGHDTTISVGNFTTVLSKNSATINCNGKSILVLNPDGTIVLTGTTSLSVSAPLINMFASNIMNFTAANVINLTAPIINLNK